MKEAHIYFESPSKFEELICFTNCNISYEPGHVTIKCETEAEYEKLVAEARFQGITLSGGTRDIWGDLF